MNIQNYPIRPSVGRSTEPWIMHIPVVSTSHITVEDTEILSELAALNHAIILKEYEEGCWIDLAHSTSLLGESAVEPMSEAFKHIVQVFQEKGYRYLRFDRDGDVIDGLIEFDW